MRPNELLSDDDLLIEAGRLAIGRLLRIGSRPFQEGDHEEFDRIQAIVKEAHDALRRQQRRTDSNAS